MARAAQSIDPAILPQLLHYCDDGVLLWKPRGPQWFTGTPSRPISAIQTTWNKRYALTEAFTTVNAKGYRMGRLMEVPVSAHHVVWALHHGRWPVAIIDHEDGNPSNNRIGNLSEVTSLQNSRNQKLRKSNTSGVMGVHYDTANDRWIAAIGGGGNGARYIVIGRFARFDDAVEARKAAEREHGYTTNHGRVMAPPVLRLKKVRVPKPLKPERPPRTLPPGVRQTSRPGPDGLPRYEARITIDGKTLQLGTFERLEDAVAARRAAEAGRGYGE